MKFRNLLIAGLFIFGANGFLTAQENGLYKIVYEADREGNRISGSLEELNNYVRNGNPIRVGWELGKRDSTGRARLEHWADAGFITILKGHVFAQISSIYGQGTSHPSIEIPFVQMMNGEPDGWVAIIGTTGVMGQKFKADQATINAYKEMGLNDEQVAEQLKAQEKSKVKTMWAVMVKE